MEVSGQSSPVGFLGEPGDLSVNINPLLHVWAVRALDVLVLMSKLWHVKDPRLIPSKNCPLRRENTIAVKNDVKPL